MSRSWGIVPGVALGVGLLLVASACTSSEPESLAPSPSASATGSPAGTPAGLEQYYSQALTWKRCPKDDVPDGATPSDYACTTIQVPRSYEDLSLGSFELAALRYGSGRAKGTLFLNPGGPGGSAVDTASQAPGLFGPDVLDAYDIVGVDPRGVERSDPVECIDDPTRDALSEIDFTPDTAAEEQAVVTLSEKLGTGCEESSPTIAPYIDSTAVVRDMDITRAAFGREKLDFLGMSYGTYLGALYADMFPDRTGRMVLDGVLPSDLDLDELSIGQVKGFEQALHRFVADCLQDDDCPLSGGTDAGVGQIRDLLAQLDKQPLPGIGSRQLTEWAATGAIINQLYATWQWPSLMAGLSAAMRGDGSVLMSQADYYNDRNSDGTFSSNFTEAFWAVTCLDSPALGGVEHARQVAPQWATLSPTFGASFAWNTLPCWQWPMGPGTAEAAGEPPVLHARGAGPILVVSTVYDPATPYDWGVQVADQLEDATLLTYEGDGHTAYTSGSECIQQKVDAYLLKGTMPADGTRCPAI